MASPQEQAQVVEWFIEFKSTAELENPHATLEHARHSPKNEWWGLLICNPMEHRHLEFGSEEDFIDENFPGVWIERRGPIPWPLRIPS
ncbi:hypothetical protein NPIL_91041 [Nephila pilipes]|uniref:Uncharacterized protein n=1 Tax=Nephila pilipes TaxID=299642 RepID=A0A8X6NZG0_NEPPI|nr:hypothetical protein NPIL_91041 [Nephila pilipes]